MLHKVSELVGYDIVATDGEIGHVDEFLIDETGRKVQYLVVNTGKWIGGRSVLIATLAVNRIDSPEKKVYVSLTRDSIRNGPTVDMAKIDPAENLPALWIF